MINKEIIRAQLDRLNKTPKVVPKEGSEFMPATLPYKLQDRSMMYDRIADIAETGDNATKLNATMAQNTEDYNTMIARQEQLQRARQQLRLANKNAPTLDPVGSSNYTGTANFPKKWGKDNIPEVSDLVRLRPNAPITTVNFHGTSFQVNKQVAPIFVGFLNELYASGYRPLSIGGYANRNIAGTNTPSLHSLGLAIDIDPSQNPVQYGGANRNILPRNVASMAAKYGLSWGGSWNSYKDPMHFSVGYGGVE